ncbi:uncharacterized protein LOC131032497 isoform X2 [Cryptomeria japonica]|uniref:uncharacterized protein LOC131032497 isoform X2 n=1 Tax=Cryptomeria japonica TaxID=3369 RepID=UPI0027DA2E1D|nr:uncharacterized protein LOC131032497 isoform X2 [Cryptomeria japonica]
MDVFKRRQFDPVEKAKIWIYTCNCNGDFRACTKFISFFLQIEAREPLREKFKFWRSFLDDKIKGTPVPKFGSAPQDKLRIIAFLNDLDHYEDLVLVQVLQVLNTVLKVCEINFIVALDKNIIRKAFQTSSENEDDVDHFISRIVELPVILVHPAVDEWGKNDNPIAKDEAIPTENN